MPRTNFFVLRDFDAEAGHHPGDLLVEVFEATLVAGTKEVLTKFENGQILTLLALKSDDGTVNAQKAYTSDLVVTTGAVTVSGPTADTSKITGVIIGRLTV